MIPRFWNTVFVQVFLLVNEIRAQNSTRTNVAIYWGQGPNQKPLLHYCQQQTIDTIIISFLHVFPEQGNGFPGSNFGNQCGGSVYSGPGNEPSKNQLQSSCPQISTAIPVCQNTFGKKIILSLGGGTNTYQLTGAANGIAFADFLWGAFGPWTPSWLSAGKPRPFDGPNGEAVEVDGFDFDIEYPSTDNSDGYIALINQLRALFPSASKPYLITGAPQCIVPDTNMAAMIHSSRFDILYIQFYNTPQCSAYSWWDKNPSYNGNYVENPSGFSASYAAWSDFLIGTASANAKIYIGLPGSPKAVDNTVSYVPSPVVSGLLRAYFCKKEFGGVVIWEATYSDENWDTNGNGSFHEAIKSTLGKLASNTGLGCFGA